jgi:hypothetical protein
MARRKFGEACLTGELKPEKIHNGFYSGVKRLTRCGLTKKTSGTSFRQREKDI